MNNKQRKVLSDALDAARSVVSAGHVLLGTELDGKHRRLLQEHGYLIPVLKGWYVLANAADRDAVTAVGYSSFWPFLGRYMHARFGNNYCLTAETSLLKYGAVNYVPPTIAAWTLSNTTSVVSLFDNAQSLVIRSNKLAEKSVSYEGLQLLPAGLCIAMSAPNMQKEYLDIVESLLEDEDVCRDAVKCIKELDKKQMGDIIAPIVARLWPKYVVYLDSAVVTSTSPSKQLVLSPGEPQAARRVANLWQKYITIVDAAVARSGIVAGKISLDDVEHQFKSDSYNSLSIEGYQVSRELIRMIADGEEPPAASAERDRMAALGYRNAFEAVKTTIGQKQPADIQEWNSKLFQVDEASILSMPIGFRREQVYIRGSAHVPPNTFTVMSCMKAFELCCKLDQHPVTLAILSHLMLCYIHPWKDGNGRTSRFLMNHYLCSSGYPWIIVPVDRRSEYFAALEEAQIGDGVEKFSQFILGLLK